MFNLKRLTASDDALLEQAAHALVETFVEFPSAWHTLDAAREEVHSVLASDDLMIAALNADGALLGWIGGLSEYNGCVYELHPLCVRPAYHGRGIGRALVTAFEAQVRERGAYTIMLGTDDEQGWTTAGNADLYADLPAAIARLAVLDRRHPLDFYRKLGYTVVGLLPDANGPGKPDLYMAKRLR